ncbi:CidA/LrgA family protein [Sutcliffiella horikoshii]|uniref:CidA/LrgA family protein n=1 Tax=Sutcliffiella horikoshii TaxID=79883 RepID=A0A5D4T0M1_9BACI|nr:CidA/LrgA family protein [Sutcliffiella horikoshii]TYS69123.1 CidA/LrgA family protein [Sutcliffiella horikoshii]
MRGMKLLIQVAVFYLFYKIGVVLQSTCDIPVPGSIIGMVFLLMLLLTGVAKERYLQDGANVLLTYLPLFFVPATVGVMDYFSILSGTEGMIMLLALLVGTIIVLVCSGLVAQKTAASVDNKTEATGVMDDE